MSLWSHLRSGSLYVRKSTCRKLSIFQTSFCPQKVSRPLVILLARILDANKELAAIAVPRDGVYIIEVFNSSRLLYYYTRSKLYRWHLRFGHAIYSRFHRSLAFFSAPNETTRMSRWQADQKSLKRGVILFGFYSLRSGWLLRDLLYTSWSSWMITRGTYGVGSSKDKVACSATIRKFKN